jgi:Dyp-type peroxidase family
VSGAWKLKAPHDGETQGLVVSGFGHLPTGRALLLEFQWEGTSGGGAWLRALRTVAPVTDAGGKDMRAAALAFTRQGLTLMGLSQAAIESFSAPFREGMFQEDRLRRIGDRRDGEWLETVIDGGPVWSGNTPPRPPIVGIEDAEDRLATSTGHAEEAVYTTTTVHALLLLYERDEAAADTWCAAVADVLAPERVSVVRRLPLLLLPDKNDIAREHFGFADGISQPIPFDAQAVIPPAGATKRDPWHGVPLGEILFGHENGHHEVAPGPVVRDDARGRAARLDPHPLAEGFLDFGRNGSYLVVRELKQDVAAFWTSMRANAEHIRQRDPQGSAHVTEAWLAERVVGRDVDGNLLCPSGKLDPKAGAPDNDFGFFDRDQAGVGCPRGSHVRRANPRDALAPTPDQKPTLLAAANNHRILRRGRKYGAPAVDPWTADGVDRGLLFMCLNTDIARQFEFVQQTWLLNPNFATLYDETDPLVGPEGPMTIHEDPLRRRITVQTFVKMVGGEYFFLPSLPAIDYLAAL